MVTFGLDGAAGVPRGVSSASDKGVGPGEGAGRVRGLVVQGDHQPVDLLRVVRNYIKLELEKLRWPHNEGPLEQLVPDAPSRS